MSKPAKKPQKKAPAKKHTAKKPAPTRKTTRVPHSTKSSLPSQPKPLEKQGKAGRPSVYSKELGMRIALKLVDGEKLKDICALPDYPSVSTLMEWALDSAHPFSEMYARARARQAELRMDEIDTLAQSALAHVQVTKFGEGVDSGAVSAIKLLVDTRKWMASKVLPKIYGDKLEVKTDAKFISLTELSPKMAEEPEDE